MKILPESGLKENNTLPNITIPTATAKRAFHKTTPAATSLTNFTRGLNSTLFISRRPSTKVFISSAPMTEKTAKIIQSISISLSGRKKTVIITDIPIMKCIFRFLSERMASTIPSVACLKDDKRLLFEVRCEPF